MFDACPVHPKGTMVIPMLWRISEYVVCMMLVHAPAKESLRSPLPHIFLSPTRCRAELATQVLGARAAAVAIAVRGVRGHSDHAVLSADRHQGPRPARIWASFLAVGAVDAVCVLGAGPPSSQRESEV